LYKPHMTFSCCPQYTIRSDAEIFKPTRDQRQCLHKWARYVLGENYIAEAAKKYPKSKEEKKIQRSEFSLIESVHAPEYSHLEKLQRIPPEPAHKLDVKLEPPVFTEEKYALFENYQRTVHHEPPLEISRGGFTNFLCRTPLKNSTMPSGMELGTYHQCYRLDGRLVAMSVLDLLTECVSGVYFMYHQDYSRWSFGKLSACREAALAREGGYRYYYMGFYIHSCPKMWYKRDYGPCHLLDPETYTWNLFDAGLANLLDKSKYVGASTIQAKASGKGGTTEAPESPIGRSQIETTGSHQGDSGDDEDRGEESGWEEDVPPWFIFETAMPGLLSKQELGNFDLGNIKIRIGDTEGLAKDLPMFEDIMELQEALTEVVATVGTEIARNMVLVLR